MLDPSIPLMAKGIDSLQMLDDGSKLAQLWKTQKTDGELSRIYKEANGDLDQMLQIGQQSPMARFVIPQLQAQKTAQQNALLERQKTEAEIGKTKSEAFKNNQQGGGFGLDNAGKLMTSANQALAVAAQTGDPMAARLALNNSLKAGAITPELYAQFDEQIKLIGNDPEKLKTYATSLVKAAQDPKYMFTTADNVLDNQTSVNNNIRDNTTSENNNVRTTNASIYNTDKDYQLGQQGLEVDKQKAYFEQNKPIDFQVGNDGYTYAVYANGKGIRVADSAGSPIKAAPNGGKSGMSATAQKELFEVGDAISAATNGIANLKDALKYSAKAYDGLGASQRAKIAGQFSDSEEATATTMLDNIVTGNALEMLKATFGGAPTEGERAILLQLQGSANLPRAQREAIYTRAIQLAERRMQSNQSKAESIRNGSYFSPGNTQAPQNQAPAGNTGGRPPLSEFFK